MANVKAVLKLVDGRIFIINANALVCPDEHIGEPDHPYCGTVYHWTWGNGSCDCNRMLLIESQYNIDLLPSDEDYRCGDTIELVSLMIDGKEYGSH